MLCVGPDESASTPRGHVAGLPDYGWRVPMSYKCNVKCSPFAKPRIGQIPQYIGLGLRYARFWIAKKRQGRRPFIDHLNQMKHKPIYGCPLGGIGSGSIGRGYKGEFCRFQMVPGMYHYHVIDANQFIVSIRRDGRTIYQKVLSCAQHKKSGSLNEWDWSFSPNNGLYHALYPRAWSIFCIPEYQLTLTCRQVSPVLPHDYLETSLPSAAFVWDVTNESHTDLEVSIAFTFKNGQGTKEDRCGGVWCQDFRLDCDGDAAAKGVAIHQEFSGMKCSYGIAAKQTEKISVSVLTTFDPNGSGAEVWQSLKERGAFSDDISFTPSPPTSKGQEIASGVCARQLIKTNENGVFEFSLSWDMPKVQFGAKENTYTRRYAQFFGTNGDAAPQLCGLTLRNYPMWEEKIEAWQDPVLKSGSLPAWYKSAIFNELYFISDGGSVWIEASESNTLSEHLTVNEFGRFAYLEGQEYRMFNTYDVHHYSSFALLMLWPKLQLSLQYHYGDTVTVEDKERVKFLMAGHTGMRKVANCIPHDIGDPEDEPWIRINAYNIHPTDDWKDLNIKFILQVYRDYAATHDMDYLDFMYPKCQVLVESAKAWDKDGDGVIDNGGYADQTFDAWVMKGASSYCGGMWLVALRMMVAMAGVLGRTEEQMEYQAMLDKGKDAFEKKLWNGSYYNYDSSTSGYHDSIMADQLAGQWFLKASGLPDNSVFPADHVRTALLTIYKNNVLGFQDGHMGAINGTRPDGNMDLTSPQSEEFWTGVTYALGATMIQEGLIEEGFKTAYGAYHTCWDILGLHFQTPEAYTANKGYRSLAYMRPLAIWAIQWAIEKFQPQLMQIGAAQDVAIEKGLNVSEACKTSIPTDCHKDAVNPVDESEISLKYRNVIGTQAEFTSSDKVPIGDNINFGHKSFEVQKDQVIEQSNGILEVTDSSETNPPVSDADAAAGNGSDSTLLIVNGDDFDSPNDLSGNNLETTKNVTLQSGEIQKKVEKASV
ncbi:hypothetical protein EGW08_011347 [Elysia chlorotica]|uniref:NLGase n=1 Tax=Elysia chlorotica TaxID=188477 RepID=A0A433TH98_ELYCH|nr:hypothetical protein EGW08_011347 [Elysia chlorotica]